MVCSWKKIHFHKFLTHLRRGTRRVLHFSFIRIISLLRSQTLVILPAFKLGFSLDKTPLSSFFLCLFFFPLPTASLSSHPPQVDLGFLRFISAIGTQGAISQETRRIYFVKSYKVDVSSNGEDWITLKEGSKQKVRIPFFFLLAGSNRLRRVSDTDISINFMYLLTEMQ